MSRIISLSVKDAPAMQAYVAAPRGDGPFPGIIVFHDAFGVNAHARTTADRLAKEGYVVIVPELFHRTAPAGLSAQFYQVSIVMPHVNALKMEYISIDMQAAYKWLCRQDNVIETSIGALGFSLGGNLAFVANSQLRLAATASFYPGQLHKEVERIPSLNGPQLFVWAGKDEHIPRSHVDTVIGAMRKADKEFVNVEMSRARHGFFFDGHIGHDAAAAKETWGLLKEFFKNKLQS